MEQLQVMLALAQNYNISVMVVAELLASNVMHHKHILARHQGEI